MLEYHDKTEHIMSDAMTVQQPERAQRLVLLFHGVGDSANGMAALGRYFADALADACVVSLNGPENTEWGAGRQWFSVQGVTEENRQARVDAAIPGFLSTVRQWQEKVGVVAAHTVLVGFSQGAIMSLEALKANPAIAGTVIAFSGRFASLPESALTPAVVHFIHGEQDSVILPAHAQAAAQRLDALCSAHSLDMIAGVGHSIDGLMLQQALGYLA